MPRGNETVTVTRPLKADKLSPTPTGTPVEFDLTNCQVLPRRSFEDGRGWITIEGWDVWCFTDPGREVLSTDHVKIRGIDYQIEGKPGRFDKRGQFKALNIVAKRVGSS